MSWSCGENRWMIHARELRVHQYYNQNDRFKTTTAVDGDPMTTAHIVQLFKQICALWRSSFECNMATNLTNKRFWKYCFLLRSGNWMHFETTWCSASATGYCRDTQWKIRTRDQALEAIFYFFANNNCSGSCNFRRQNTSIIVWNHLETLSIGSRGCLESSGGRRTVQMTVANDELWYYDLVKTTTAVGGGPGTTARTTPPEARTRKTWRVLTVRFWV